MKIHELIESLETDTQPSRLPNLSRIISKLKEMDSMIEMDEVKTSFVSQLLLIIKLKRMGFRHPFKKMHTVLTGPPGVGKSNLSKLMAEIWHALGIIGDDACPTSPPRHRSSGRELALEISDVSDKISTIMLMIDQKYSDSDNIPEIIKTIYSLVQDSSETCDEIMDKFSHRFTEMEDALSDMSECSTDVPYVLAGRESFIGTHQGHTSQKTVEFLEKNRGKVIVIEEAYSLFTDERDSYGMEALTLINRYMDEFPEDYIFIFNGYGDKIDQSIFRAQPGIKRRIQWRFNIKEYSWEGIYKIFLHQLSRFRNPIWTILEKELPLFRLFFSRNAVHFPHFGGDTEKLILFLQLEYGKRYFFEIDSSDDTIYLKYEILENSFSEYKKKCQIDHQGEHIFGFDLMYS